MHVKRDHGQLMHDMMYLCHLCPKQYPTKQGLATHIKKHEQTNSQLASVPGTSRIMVFDDVPSSERTHGISASWDVYPTTSHYQQNHIRVQYSRSDLDDSTLRQYR